MPPVPPPGSLAGPPRPPDAGPPDPSATGAPKPPRRNIGTVAALGAALLALLLAVVASLLSWRALDQANDARDIATAGGSRASGSAAPQPPPPEPPPSPTGEPGEEPPPPGDPTATPALPPLGEEADYVVKYPKDTLRLQTGCGTSQAIDADRPQVRNDAIDDVQFNPPCSGNPAFFELHTATRGARADSPNVTARDCRRLIETSPLGTRTEIPARKGTVLCILTSLDDAAKRGERPVVAVIQVTGVADDGSVSVSVIAWILPG